MLPGAVADRTAIDTYLKTGMQLRDQLFVDMTYDAISAFYRLARFSPSPGCYAATLSLAGEGYYF